MTTVPSLSDRSSPPGVSVNFTEPAINRDPYAIFRELREMGPVVYNEATDSWMVTRFDLSRKVLRQSATFDQDHATMLAFLGGHHLVTIQPPMHTTVRGVFRHEFQRDTLENWQELVSAGVHKLSAPLVERVKRGETVDFIPTAVQRIPAYVILGMLGIESAGDEFRGWIHAMIGIINAVVEPDPVVRARLVEEGIVAREEALQFCAGLLAERRARPGGHDLVSLLVASSIGSPDPSLADDEEGAGVTHMRERDLMAQVAQLVIAAQDNTANMMSASLVYLAEYPEVRRRLLADRSLVPAFVEELLRHHGSIMITPRLVQPGGASIAGLEIPEGEQVWVMNGCANRDEQRWDRADEFDIDREMLSNVAFGFGSHACLGVNLARMEITTFIGMILDEVPDFELVPGGVDYGTTFFTRGPQSVLIQLPEAAAATGR